jgi:hypothetical protein
MISRCLAYCVEGEKGKMWKRGRRDFSVGQLLSLV